MPTVSANKDGGQNGERALAPRFVLSIDDLSAWPEISPAASLVELEGPLGAWAGCDEVELRQFIEKLPSSATISLQIDGAECEEDAAAFERIMEIQKLLSDRGFVDFVIAPADVLYPRTDMEKRRAAFLSIATAEFLKQNVPVRWLIPLTGDLTYRLETFFIHAQSLGAQAIIAGADASGMGRNECLFAADFIRYRLLEEGEGLMGHVERHAYEAMLAMLESGDPENIDSLCLKLLGARPQLIEGRRKDQRFDFIKDALGVLSDGARAHLLRLRAFGKHRDKAVASARFEKVLLIGAYGGEHIGDAAILGGVAFRLHARHGVRNAILMSQRPAHTRHLMPMIETPVNIEVREYHHAEIDACIAEVDAVIFAGGPFIDLPKQLVLHLYAVSRAKILGKPFLMEGVGPGPIQRLPSKWTARQIISLADYVSVRTRESVDVDIVKEVDVEIGRDPAFDYLETRQSELSRMPPHETHQIEHLVENAKDRFVIGVNIRPIYDQYTVGVKEADKASYTKMVEGRFERRLAEAITLFSKKRAAKPVVIFFPMNAVQFGLSDLKSAYRITRHFGSDVDFRVWEADASLDGVLSLIRRLDIAITMRFHATIFALSQGIETVGVDYRIGQRDKVAAVLSDAGKSDQCARIDEMTVEWLVGQLERHAGGGDATELKTG